MVHVASPGCDPGIYGNRASLTRPCRKGHLLAPLPGQPALKSKYNNGWRLSTNVLGDPQESSSKCASSLCPWTLCLKADSLIYFSSMFAVTLSSCMCNPCVYSPCVCSSCMCSSCVYSLCVQFVYMTKDGLDKDALDCNVEWCHELPSSILPLHAQAP